ncbi:MAG: hypothetical protein WCP97_05595 [bacterium]
MFYFLVSLTFLGWLGVRRYLPFIKNRYLQLSFGFFLGHIFAALVLFLVACIASLVVPVNLSVISTLSLLVLEIVVVCIAFTKRQELRAWIKKYLGYPVKKKLRLLFSPLLSPTFLFVLFCFVFSFILLLHQLAIYQGIIYTTQVYWDFKWHVGIIQNFMFGNNFPPQNDSFAGTPLLYHFFYDFLVSIYASLGSNVADAMTFFSIATFFFFLLSLLGLAKELFHRYSIGILAVILTLTSSSLHFWDSFQALKKQPLWQVLKDIFTTSESAYRVALLKDGAYGYNGNFYNIFLFVAERQIIFAGLFMIFFMVMLYYQQHLSKMKKFVVGLLFGFFFLWHSWVFIMVGVALGFLFIFSKERKSLLPFMGGMLLGSLPFILYYRMVMGDTSVYLAAIREYPRLEFTFPTMDPEYPLSLQNALVYYLYAYGFKLLFIIAGSLLLWKKNRRLALVLFAFFPTFILANTVQLSPLSVYDNHHWIRMLNVVFDIIVAYALVELWIWKKYFGKFVVGVSMVLLTLSGVIELVPYFSVFPGVVYGKLNSDLVEKIREQTAPKSVFLSSHQRELHLAGRKVFYGTYSPGELPLDVASREQIAKDIYGADSRETLCSLVQDNHIDYVEAKETFKLSDEEMSTFPRLVVHDSDGLTVVFYEVGMWCGEENDG